MIKPLENLEVRCVIKDVHDFKLPPTPASGGWRGADWRDEVWQGTVKVVERGQSAFIILVDRIFGVDLSVIPIKDGAVHRCIDSRRYFVLRIENALGRHMVIGMAFNERNDAFDLWAKSKIAKDEPCQKLQPARELISN